ncbi:low affinity iron permease family protein [Asticcacaulis sp. AND118]|uniref:low affinity iron permease family protein n=1 Tax=Asticcacaulis sp. AND118 TaxID=2840468 RepID=UPI001CFF8571|nr:low affinity iron permease family protein [Asticcacaulis sp. AND118]UDF04386.1 low affinity iron permease family protein [Asticcacaulis sp. AND118]
MSKSTEKAHKKGWFVSFAQGAAVATGSAWAFGLAVGVVIVWIVTGPLFKFSDTWQLVINTGTTIVTFLMVFLIQNTQNRDAKIMQLKLDELIRAATKAHTAYIDMENMSEKELAALQKHYEDLAKKARDEGDHKAAEAHDKAGSKAAKLLS